jgi:prepilin-type N-terminal cleavage/methylation domain-containing protein
MRLDRRGFTLYELFVVLVLIGLVGAISFPKMMQIGNGSNLRGARGAMLTALNVAKSSAVTTGKCGYLKVNNDAVTVFLVACGGGSQTEVISNRNFGSDYGVDVTLTRGAGSPLAVDSIGFDPRGIPINNTQSAVFTFTRSGETKIVTVGNYGRLQ